MYLFFAAAPGRAAESAIPLAAAVRAVSRDEVLTAADRVRVEQNRSARLRTTAPRIGPFVDVGRNIDNRAPGNNVVDEAFTTDADFVRFDAAFGGVELRLPVVGGFLNLRAGERATALRLSEDAARNPNTTRFRLTGDLTIPIFPWRLDLAQLSERELLNEVQYRRSWADYRNRVTEHFRRAATAAWRARAIADVAPLLAEAETALDSATLLQRYGEISALDLAGVVSTLRDMHSLYHENVAELDQSRLDLDRFFGGAFTIVPPMTLLDADSIVLPPLDDATDVLVVQAEASLARTRTEIARKETGPRVEFRANALDEYFQDVPGERQRTFTGITGSIPFYDPAGASRRTAAEAEVELAGLRLADARRRAGARIRMALSDYRQALRHATTAEADLAYETDRLAVSRAEHENYTDPLAIVRVARSLGAVARERSRLYEERERATVALIEGLVNAGVGIETLAGYLE